MPKYTCERCLKDFSQMSHYTKHQNKKLPCQDNKGKIEEVVENIIINKKLISNNTENIIIKTQDMDIDLQEFIKCDVFTPDDISKLMASKLNNKGNILEPSVGSGNLLKYINLKNYEYVDIFERKKQYLDSIPFNEKINVYNCDFIKNRLILNMII